MRMFRARRPSPALVVACIALVMALGGTSYAAFTLPKNSVGAKQLKKNAVTTRKIKNGAVTNSKIKNGAVTASKINTTGLTVPNALNAGNANTLNGQPASAFEPASKIVRFNVRTSAGQTVPLLSAGSLSFSFKCGHNTTDPAGNAGRDFGAIEISTSQNGALFTSSFRSAPGNGATPFLNTDSTESNRIFQMVTVATGNSFYRSAFDGGVAIAPDGSSVSLSDEGTGIGVNVLGSDCVANGYAVIES